MDPFTSIPSDLDDISSQELQHLIPMIPDLTSQLRQNTNEILNQQLEYEEMQDNYNFMKFSIASLSTSSLPSFDEFSGDYEFTAELKKSDSPTWFYSDVLQQIFIDMNKVLVINFKVLKCIPGLYVRALPVYSDCDYKSEAVDRCVVHAKEDDPLSKAHSVGSCECDKFNNVGHVIRVNMQGAIYCYNDESERHSVLVPLTIVPPEVCFPVPFTFSCKTSCIKGMHRRTINVVLTLENSSFETVGRRVFKVKICSCPKRDMARQERDHLPEEYPKPRKMPKPKRETTYVLPRIQMVLTQPIVEDKKENLKNELRALKQDILECNERIKQDIIRFNDRILQLENQVNDF